MLTFDIPLIRLADGDIWSVLLIRSGATLIAAFIIRAIWMRLSSDAPRLVPGRRGLFVAALYGLSSITFMVSVHNTSTANLVFILAFNTMFAALLSWLFLRERPRPATLVAMPAMVLGVFVIVGGGIGSGSLLGDGMALASTFLLAAAITLTRAGGRDMGLASLAGVALPFVISLFVVGTSGFHVAEPWWMLLNGFVVMPVSFYCLAAGPKYLSAPEVAMFYLLETIFAPIWVWIVFSETPARNSFIGGAILVVTLVAHSLWQLHEGRRRRAALAVHHPA